MVAHKNGEVPRLVEKRTFFFVLFRSLNFCGKLNNGKMYQGDRATDRGTEVSLGFYVPFW